MAGATPPYAAAAAAAVCAVVVVAVAVGFAYQRVETLVNDGWGPCLLHRVSAVIAASLSARVDALAAAIQNLSIKDEGPRLPVGGPQGGPPDGRAERVLNEALNMWDYYCDTTVRLQRFRV